MDEGRLAAVKRYSKYNRKFVYVLNDIIKNKQDLYDHCLSREQQEARSRLVAEVVDMRKAVVRKRVLLQCLHMKRQNASNPSQLGVYCGRSLQSFTKDIDQTIAWHHPRLRRLRQVDRMKQRCLEKGAILDDETVKGKVDDFFSKSLVTDAATTLKKLKKPKSKSRGHLFLDEDSDLDLKKLDLHDPIGAAKITLKFRSNALGKIAGLRPNYRTDEQEHVLNENSIETIPQEKTHQGNAHRIHSQTTDKKDVSQNATNEKLSLNKFSKPLPAISSENDSTTALGLGAKNNFENVEISKDEEKKSSRDNPDGANNLQETNTTHQSNDDAVKVKNSSKPSSDEESPKLTRGRTLILPPIQPTKEMMKKRR